MAEVSYLPTFTSQILFSFIDESDSAGKCVEVKWVGDLGGSPPWLLRSHGYTTSYVSQYVIHH